HLLLYPSGTMGSLRKSFCIPCINEFQTGRFWPLIKTIDETETPQPWHLACLALKPGPSPLSH
ncbi:hypothetical protein, partial [Pseudomonas viridiflava]|uniref:hypothetical protein n=1 Tax=Pseudomonas viridiflava TaxID=33069 RepID=UPI0019D199F2